MSPVPKPRVLVGDVISMRGFAEADGKSYSRYHEKPLIRKDEGFCYVWIFDMVMKNTATAQQQRIYSYIPSIFTSFVKYILYGVIR